jgi:heme-degrading monooxygenase HmoA
MIIRQWRGRAIASAAAGYPEHFRAKVLPVLRQTKGFVGAQLGRRELGDTVEFLVLTRWTSLDAVRAFAGADVDRAVLEPGALAVLTDYDLHVQHYEVLEDAST